MRASLLVLSLLCALPARAQELGAKVGPFTFKDARTLPRTLDAFGERDAFVLAFVTSQCPIARRYLPKLARLEAAYRDRGVQVVVVDVGLEDDLVTMAAFALEHDLPMPIVKDLDGQVVRALGVTRTPEVVVLDA
jgi:peroxiredoxin